jgi:hypothetical protein
MVMSNYGPIDRRGFLRQAGVASSALAWGAMGDGLAAQPDAGVALILDPRDPVAQSAPAQWAANELQQALAKAGCKVRRIEQLRQAETGEIRILAVSSSAPGVGPALKAANVTPPTAAESLALFRSNIAGAPGLIACGVDARGLSYALLELTDRVRFGASPGQALSIDTPIAERPANPVRSVMRQFTSELMDKPWFYDRECWSHYLDLLAGQRFNRLHLAFGLGYDDLKNVADSYVLFLYPFLLSVPGYKVRATNLTNAERDRNLDTLRYVSEQAFVRGLDFQLGIWMHGYQWPTSPRAKNTIEGLTPQTHGAYCRDALAALLRACPAISSVALRIHGESGIAEGSYNFWSTIFDGVKRCGRIVEIDLHAKGIDARMIDAALATGMPVNVAPKYWAEHLGMPYHQAAIRDLEMPVAGHTGAGLMTLSEGSRSFTRYGYADLLRDDRKYTVRHRVFSGTQRLLLWGDPAAAAAYSRMFQFCGSTGVDLMEPLTCRGRRGTGTPGSRTGYLNKNLEPHWDWEKYAYWYRVWGRMLYNPDTSMEVFERHFGAGPAAASSVSALANASRILPLVTTAHLPSAACDAYWPEIYWNQPMVAEEPDNPYTDTPAPKTFQHVSPLDPQLFSGISDFAAELLEGKRSARYSPLEVAAWLDGFADAAARDAQKSAAVPSFVSDVSLQIGLGHFFASKFRSGVLYAIHERTGDRKALEQALGSYRAARSVWAQMAPAYGDYRADLSSSDRRSERGAWGDRLAAIDRDIAQMEQRLAAATESTDPRVAAAIAAVHSSPSRERADCRHQPPPGFHPKQAVTLEVTVESPRAIESARLIYRHVNQAERYESVPMEAQARVFRASIPATYTDSQYPLQYYFEFSDAPDNAWLYPGFAPDLANQPYYVLRRI